MDDGITEASSATCSAAIGDHLLVGECRSGDLRLLNPTAARIWRGVESGSSAQAIARSIAADFAIPYAQSEADVLAVLASWRGTGLATGEATPETAGPQLREAGRRRYRLGPACVEARYRLAAQAGDDGRRFLERVIEMFAALEEGACEAEAPAVELVVGRNPARVFGPFCRALLRRAYGPFDWLFTMHAAGAALGAHVIALIAPEGGGKSTLTAHLVARGGSIFADDLLTIDPGTTRALPLPVAIGVKHGSIAALERAYPGIERLQEHRYGVKAARYLRVPTAARALRPSPLGALVFVRFAAGTRCRMERVDAAESARCLMEAGIVFGQALRPEMLRWLAALAMQTPSYALRYSRLDEAEAALRSIA